jgi:diguanylate cyclase (GGDEF)-like protein
MGTPSDGHHGDTPASGHHSANHETHPKADAPHTNSHAGDRHTDGAHHGGAGTEISQHVWGSGGKGATQNHSGEGAKAQGHAAAHHGEHQTAKAQGHAAANHGEHQTAKAQGHAAANHGEHQTARAQGHAAANHGEQQTARVQGHAAANHGEQQTARVQGHQSANHHDSPPRKAEQQTGKTAPPSENFFNRFIAHPLDETAKAYNELVAPKKTEAPPHPHAEKLKPEERAQHKIRECDNNGKTFHYDEHGRIASISGKNKPTVLASYDKNGQVDGVKVFKADGQMQARYEHQAHVDLRINQTTGEVVATQKSTFKAEDAKPNVKDVPSVREERITADGVKTVLDRDLKGHRLESSVYGPDERRVSRTKYHYNHADATGHPGSVTAAEYRGDGRTLHREYVYDKPQALEKNVPSMRIDHSYPPDKTPGRFVEQTKTYDLHHDKVHPIATRERVNDFSTGITTIDESSFAGGKQTEKRHISVDEMGRPMSMKLDNEKDHIHVAVKFNKNGAPESVSGDKGGHSDKDLLKSAECLVAMRRNEGQITPMAHEMLLAYRGPTKPRAGDAPSGNLVYMKDGHFVEQKVVLGEIKEGDKVIGHVNDKGQVEINGESFNIISDGGYKAAFTGLGTDGRYLDLTQGQAAKDGEKRGEGFSGCITNGVDTKIVLGGHMFASSSNKFFGQFDNQGKVKFSQDLDQHEKDDTALSAVLKNGYQFHGNDCGNSRDFNLDRTSHGTVNLELDGKKQPCELQLGMLIDPTTKKQLGNYIPPTLNGDGSFDKGEIVLNGQSRPLSSFTNTSFRVTVDGQDKEMNGYVLGPQELQVDGTIRPNKGGVVNLDAYLGGMKDDCDAKLKALNQAKSDLETVKAMRDPDGGQYANAAAEREMQEEIAAKQKAYDEANTRLSADKAAIDKSANGAMDASTFNRLKDSINTDPLASPGEAFSADPKARLERLKAAIDKPNHVLESFAPGAKVDGDILAIDPAHPGKKIPCSIDQNVLYDKEHHKAIGSLDPSTGIIRLFSANGQSLTMSMADRSMAGSVIHMKGEGEGGKPITVDWINDGQNRLHSVEQERKQVALERGYATLLAGNADSGPPLEMLNRTRELEHRYLSMLDDTVANRQVGAKNIDGVNSLEMLRGGPRDFVRAEQNREGKHYTGGRVDVPVLGDEQACARAGGPMRIGNGHFFADNGKIYKMSYKSHDVHLKLDAIGLDKTFSTEGWVRDEQSCGYLKPGYVANIDGHDINLQNDPNFLFKMKVGNEQDEHWIMGLGEPHRDANGSLVSGGLVDARELFRKTGNEKHQVDLAVDEYKKNETWGIIGSATDRSIGGREAVLDRAQAVAGTEESSIHRQIEETFNQGLHGNNLATKDIDHNLRSVQNMMRDMNLSATDANEMSRQGQSFQSGVREGTALVVTTLASGGTSLLVQGGALTFRAGLGVATLTGGLGTALVKQTRGGDVTDFMANTASGGMETLLMFTGAGVGKSATNFSEVSKEAGLVNVLRDEQGLVKLQAVAKEGNLYKSLEEMAELKRLHGVVKPTTQAMEELVANPRAMELVDIMATKNRSSVKAFCELINDKTAVKVMQTAVGKPVAVLEDAAQGANTAQNLVAAQRKLDAIGKLGRVTNAYYQATGFSLINSARNANTDELTFDKLASGGLYMLGGEMVGSLTHVPVGKKFNLGEKGFGHFIDTMITSYPDAVINNSVFSGLTARANSEEVERGNVAHLLHMDKDMVSDKLYEMYRDQGRINSYIWDQVTQGAMTATFSHPFTHSVTHFLGEHVEAKAQENWNSSMKEQKADFQTAAIEARINALPLEGLAAHRSEALRNADGSFTRVLKNEKGELTQVTLPDGAALTKIGDHWRASQLTPEYQNLKDVKVDDHGNVSIEKTNRSRLTLHPDGSTSEHRIFAPGHEEVKVTRRDGQVSTVEKENGKVTAVRIEKPRHDQPGAPPSISESKISYDQNGRLNKVEVAGGADLVRDAEGWSLQIDGRKVKQNAFHDLEVLDDGTIIKSRKAGDGDGALRIVEHPDGSILTVKDGIVQFARNRFGDSSTFVHDKNGKLSEVIGSSGEKFHRDGEGWVRTAPGQPERRLNEVSVDKDGRVRLVDEHGIAREYGLDGRFEIKAPGDPAGTVSYKNEKEHFDQLLAKVSNPVMREHIREGILDLHDKVRATSKDPDKVLGDVLYDVNRMLSKEGHFDAAEVPKLIDEALSIAAKPDLLSQGGFSTCVVTAAQQREFALHPDTMFRMLRRLHENEMIVGANGRSIAFDKAGKTALPDDDARSHYSADGRTRADGRRLRVSQIFQQAFCDVIADQHPGRTSDSDYYATDIEPMMTFITGRRERFVVVNPTDAHDLSRQLLDIKRNGDLYAIVHMDARHIGALGYLESGGHVRIVKDIRSPLEAEDKNGGQSLKERFDAEGNAIAKGKIDINRMVIDFGNTWSRSASHETLSPDEAYRTTLNGRSEQNLENLVARVKAAPTDPFERLELAAWKLGFLDAATKSRNSNKVDLFAEDALQQLYGTNQVKFADLMAELHGCKEDLLASVVKRDPALAEEVNRILAGLPEERLPLLVAKDQNVDMAESKAGLTGSEREYLQELRGIKQFFDNRASGSLDLARKLRLKDNAYESASIVDNVTGYANYKGTKRWLEKTIENLKKDPSKELHFIYIDVRKFKNANGEMGKEGGDDALRYLTKHMAKELGLRPDELAARPGGDELAFALLRPKGEDITDLVKKIESTYLGCRNCGESHEGTRQYGMKFVDGKYKDEMEVVAAKHMLEQERAEAKRRELGDSGDQNSGKEMKPIPGELIVYPVVGAVTYHSGDTAHHLIERADKLMNMRKDIDNERLKEIMERLRNDQDVTNLDTKQISPYDHSFQVTHREDRDVRQEVDMSGAPRLTTEDIKRYSSLTVEQKQLELGQLQSDIDGGRNKIYKLHRELLRQNEVLKERKNSAQSDSGDPSVTADTRDEVRKQLGVARSEVAYQRRLQEDIKVFDSLPESNRHEFIETIDSLRDLYKNSAEQYEEAFRNPHTKRENREMCDRALLRALHTAEENKNHPGFQPFSLFMVDIDNMKAVNDAPDLGHDAGNQMLSHAGAYLRDHLPPGCQCFSPSGGAFVIIAPDAKSREVVESVLKQYGTDPHTGATRAAEAASPFVPNIDMSKVEDSGKLKFGFSYGESTYSPEKNSGRSTDEKRHARYVSIIDKMKIDADDMLNADKKVRIADGRLKPRKTMEVYEKHSSSADYTEWSTFVNDRTPGSDWQRPKETESVIADFRKHMQEAAKERKDQIRSAAEERKNQIGSATDRGQEHLRAGHGKNGEAEADDLFTSTLQGLNLSQRSQHGDLDDDELPLNFKEHSLIPDNYLPGSVETGSGPTSSNTADPSDGSKESPQRTAGGATRRDGSTNDGTRMMSENELADMPQESSGQVSDNPLKQQPFPYDVHAQNEALRLQRNADLHKLFSKEPPQPPEAVTKPTEKVHSKPLDLDRLSGEFQQRFKDDREALTDILSDNVWCFQPKADANFKEARDRFDARKAHFNSLRDAVQERLINLGGDNDTRPIKASKILDPAYVRDKLAGSPDELHLYENFWTAREQLATSGKAVKQTEARLDDLQNIVDRFCEKKDLPRTKIEIGPDEPGAGRVLENGAIRVSRAELDNDRPSPELIALLCDGVQYGRETRADQTSARESAALALKNNYLEHNDPGRMVNDKDSPTRDVLLYGQLRAADHSCFQDDVLRQFAGQMKDCLKEWKPLDPGLSKAAQDVEIGRRRDQLAGDLGKFLEGLGYSAPRINIVDDAATAAKGDRAAYAFGAGECDFRRSRFASPDAGFIEEIAHEVIGHVIQDQLVMKVSLLNQLRKMSYEDLSKEFGSVKMVDGKPVFENDKTVDKFLNIVKGDFLSDPKATLKGVTSKTEIDQLKDVLARNYDWIKERLVASPDVLDADPDCMRARRLMISLQAPRELIDAEGNRRSKLHTETPEAVREHTLFNLLAGRLPDAPISESDMAQVGKLLVLGQPLPGGKSPQELMADVLKSPAKYFGYDPLHERFTSSPDKNNPDAPNNKIDKLFNDLLGNQEFLKKNPDFFQKLVDCNSTASLEGRQNLRQEWVAMIGNELGDDRVGPISSPKLQARLDLLAYEVMRKHFNDENAGDLGALTRKSFEEKESTLVAQLLRDNLAEAQVHSHLLYRANFYEVEPHYIQYRVREFLRANDFSQRNEIDNVTDRRGMLRAKPDRLELAGKILIDEKDDLVKPPSVKRTISLNSKEQPEQLR